MIDGQGGRPFNEWLRMQLRAKRMSQRQLAHRSGVDHSTISRLVRGDRTPSLETATKLARGLRELREDQEPTQYLGALQSTPTNPVARVEYSLRADEVLDEGDIRVVMETYLAARLRRLRGAVSRVTRADAQASAARRSHLALSAAASGRRDD
jgi:transcriptional regulator with XRE-family HTH domain